MNGQLINESVKVKSTGNFHICLVEHDVKLQIVSAYHRTPLLLLKTFCVFLTWELAMQKNILTTFRVFAYLSSVYLIDTTLVFLNFYII